MLRRLLRGEPPGYPQPAGVRLQPQRPREEDRCDACVGVQVSLLPPGGMALSRQLTDNYILIILQYMVIIYLICFISVQ